MIKLLGLGFAVALSASVSASDGGEVSHVEYCQTIESFAGEIMLARQAGASYSNLYASLSKVEDDAAKNVMLALLKTAYNDYKQYRSDKYRDRAISKFKNLVFMTCMDNKG
jgi:hypothetical protein